MKGSGTKRILSSKKDEHVSAVPASGGFTLLLGQKKAYKTLTKEQERFSKRILILDDEADVTSTFKAVIEDSNNDVDVNKRIEVYTSNDPVIALSEFKPNFYDLLLVDRCLIKGPENKMKCEICHGEVIPTYAV